MKKLSIKKMTLAAVLAALCCVMTMLLSFRMPGGGYIHPGDSIILISGILFGPICGLFAGGIGSMLADIFLGYPAYAPFTLVIKGLMGFTAGMIADYGKGKKTLFSVRSIFAVFACEAVMVIGYFFTEIVIIGELSGGIATVPSNLLQAGGGAVLYFIFAPIIAMSIKNIKLD